MNRQDHLNKTLVNDSQDLMKRILEVIERAVVVAEGKQALMEIDDD